MTHSPGDCLEDLLKLDHFHVSAFVRLPENMDDIEDAGDRTLPDNTIFILGAGMGHSTTYQYTTCQ